jgi:hypothetical protein
MEPQLYMGQPLRQRIMRRHDFYVAEIKRRVIAQFRDIEGEAKHYFETEYERLGELPGDEHSDMEWIADAATDRAHAFYALLSDLKEQMILGALAGLYHQWDKDLREFIESELRHNYQQDFVAKIAWDSAVGNVFKILAEFGWDCTTTDFFTRIDACRLIVNVYKHGQGQSLSDLATRHPKYLDVPMKRPWSKNQHLSHHWLSISDTVFDELADGLRAFWVAFPERLFLKTA